VVLTTVQRGRAGVSGILEDVERTTVNENSTPRLVANPNRIQVRTEADLRRSAPPADPAPDSASEKR
jgi:hypothetical protein